MHRPKNKDVIIDFEGNEDCGVYRIDDKTMLLQSVDVITPVVDDPYLFGKIAACNALSDIFAMGGEAKTALNILMWDKEHVSKQALQEILRGGMEKIVESNASLLGGHTIVDREQKYGLSVGGLASKIWRNNTANIGDAIILCKPIGSGLITTALKQGKMQALDAKECLDSMERLNLYASRVAQDYPISACTDITGFGLIGHLYEMCNNKTAIALNVSEIPFFENMDRALKEGCVSGGSKNNQKYFQKFIKNEANIQDDIALYDAQTSGGIVFALPKEKAKNLLNILKKSGYERASIIGEFIPSRDDCKIVLG